MSFRKKSTYNLTKPSLLRKSENLVDIRLGLLLFFCCCISRLPAQNENIQNFRLLNQETGLPSDQVNCFSKDKRGFLWIGTSNGLVRFDGSRLLIFKNDPKDSTSISGNFITDIELEGDSVMWVATAKNGLNKYHFKSEKFTRFFPDKNNPGSLPSEEILELERDLSGNLWVGFHRAQPAYFVPGENRFRSVNLPLYGESRMDRASKISRSFLFDPTNKSKVWILTMHELFLYDIEKEEFTQHSPNDQFAGESQLPPASFGHGLITKNGLLFLSSGNGVYEYDPKKWKWRHYTNQNSDGTGKDANAFIEITRISENEFWIANRTGGISTLNRETGKITENALCSDSPGSPFCSAVVYSFDVSEERGIWLGTSKGLLYSNPQQNQFNVITQQANRKNLKNRFSVVALHQHDSTGFYFGGFAGEGLYFLNLNTYKSTLFLPPSPFEPGNQQEMFYIRGIIPESDSSFIVLSDNALFRFDLNKKALEEIKTGLEFQKDYYYFHRIFAHSDGSYYISTRHNGIYKLNADFKISHHLYHDEDDSNSLISSNYIYEIVEDPTGKLWIGTEDGFSIYNPESAQFENHSYKNRLDSVPLLKIIFSIGLAPDSSLWFIDGRAHGVFLEYPYKRPFDFEPIITGPSGERERLNRFYFTRDGNQLLLTPSGLTIEEKSGDLVKYGEKQGLPPLNILSPVLELFDGSLVLGGKNKLVIFHPDSLRRNYSLDPPYLAGINIFNQRQEFNEEDLLEKGLELSYLQNFFSIDLGVINFVNPGEYFIAYRLQGLNDEWIYTKDRKAVFTNISGGNYTFEARVVDQNNTTSEQVLTLPIFISPPLWETWWFRLSVVVFFTLIALSFYLLRIRSIRREAALKTEFNTRIANMELSALRAQMNPHFLHNSLNSIRHHIISNKPLEADKYLVKFSRLVRQVLNNSREQLVSLENEITALELYMEIEAGRFDHSFSHEIILGKDIDPVNVKIPPMILQPFVENSIWHGLLQKDGQKAVWIEISRCGQNLIITIEDNGIGRKKAGELKSKSALKQNSMGIKITGNRLEIIEKIYKLPCYSEIEDLFDASGQPTGTRVTITLPLIYESESSHS